MAANSEGAGFYANLTAAQLDQDLGSDAATILNALDRAHRRYQTYWLPMGTDAVNGYQALKTAAGDTQAATDYGNASTAAALMEKLYQVLVGNATIAVDSQDQGNGVVTVGATGSGFNFSTFLNRVVGDQVG
jgi:hypothetical protein